MDKVYEAILSLMIVEKPSDCPLIDKVIVWQQGLLVKTIAALKRAQSISLESKLVKLIKLMKWMEGRLSEKVIFPRMSNLENASLSHPRAPTTL